MARSSSGPGPCVWLMVSSQVRACVRCLYYELRQPSGGTSRRSKRESENEAEVTRDDVEVSSKRKGGENNSRARSYNQ